MYIRSARVTLNPVMLMDTPYSTLGINPALPTAVLI